MKSAETLKARLGGNMRESMSSARPEELPPFSRAGSANSALHGGAQAKYQGSARIKDALAIELSRIAPDPNQPRKEFDQDALAELAASLKDKGQLQAVLVRWDDASGKWIIVAGERRYQAAILAGLPTLNCIEYKAGDSADDRLEVQLIENALREDLKPIEQANAFKALLERRKWSHRDLAANLHIAPSSVSRAMALLTLPPAVQEQVEQGALPASTAIELVRLEDPKTIIEVALEAAASKSPRSEVKRKVEARESAKGKGGSTAKSKPPAPKPLKPRTFRIASGGKITVEPPRKATDPAVMLSMIEEAARVLRAELGLSPAEQGGSAAEAA